MIFADVEAYKTQYNYNTIVSASYFLLTKTTTVDN